MAVGLKVTDTVHEAPAARELPQVLVSLYPVGALIEEIDAAALPVLVTVTDCAALEELTVWLPKESEVGDALSVAVAVEVPVPDSATLNVLLVALLVTVRSPL